MCDLSGSGCTRAQENSSGGAPQNNTRWPAGIQAWQPLCNFMNRVSVPVPITSPEECFIKCGTGLLQLAGQPMPYMHTPLPSRGTVEDRVIRACGVFDSDGSDSERRRRWCNTLSLPLVSQKNATLLLPLPLAGRDRGGRRRREIPQAPITRPRTARTGRRRRYKTAATWALTNFTRARMTRPDDLV